MGPIALMLKGSYPTIADAQAALLAESNRLFMLEFNPRQVPGSLLAGFDQDWPEGLCWEFEPLWGEKGPDPKKIYDIDGVELFWDEGGHEHLDVLVKKYLDSRTGE